MPSLPQHQVRNNSPIPPPVSPAKAGAHPGRSPPLRSQWLAHLRMGPDVRRDDIVRDERIPKIYPTYPRPKNLCHTSSRSRRQQAVPTKRRAGRRGARGRLGLRVDAEDRPGRAGGKVDLGVFRTAGANPNLKRGLLAACAINPASCGAVFASFYTTTKRGEDRPTPCHRDGNRPGRRSNAPALSRKAHEADTTSKNKGPGSLPGLRVSR